LIQNLISCTLYTIKRPFLCANSKCFNINYLYAMVYAYIRVSTEEQSYEGQRYELECWSVTKDIAVDIWVKEKVSGMKSLEKRTLGWLLKRLKPGDTLICTELSRLGRNMMMVMSILNTCSQKNIRLFSVKDHFELSDSLNSRIIAFAFSLAAEIERNLISQRTREALAAKRQAGIHLGRPKGASSKRKYFDEHADEIRSGLENGATIGELAKHLKVHRNTLSRYLKDR